METCVCAPIDIADLEPGDVYHTTPSTDWVMRQKVAEGRASDDTLFQHNETLFFTVESVEFDGEDTWTIVNRNNEGSACHTNTLPTLFLVRKAPVED